MQAFPTTPGPTDTSHDDGFWERGLKAWDTAAGAVIVAEAGGHLTDFSGGPFDPFKPEIVATNGLIHRQLLDVMEFDSTSRR